LCHRAPCDTFFDVLKFSIKSLCHCRAYNSIYLHYRLVF